MQSFFLHYLTVWQPLGYLIVFLVLMVEGDAVVFAAAFLTHRGIFSFWPMIATAYAGVIIGNALWYEAGQHLDRLPFFQRIAKPVANFLDPHIRKHPVRMLFLTNFTYGLHRATLLRTGALRIPTRTFLLGIIPPGVVWLAAVFSLGYASSISLAYVEHSVKYVELGLLLAFCGYIVLTRWLTLQVKQHIEQE